MAFQLTPLHIPSLTTDFSAQTNATARLGEMLGNLPGEMQKQRLAQQKQQTLASLGEDVKAGNWQAAGAKAIALGDMSGGAALLGFGQKQQDRDAERNWLGGGAAATQPLGGSTAASAKMPPAEVKAIIDANVPEADREYAYRMAQKESSFNPGAVSPTGAKGLFQFTGGTGRQYGLVDRAGDIRDNPTANTQAFVRFTEDNRQALRQALGRDPTYGELALAHQQGAGGAIALITGKGDVNPNNLRVNNADPNAPRSESARRIMAYYGYGDTQPSAAPTGQPAQVAQANAIPGENAAKLRADAQYYAQTNPEAARQMNARADALEQSRGSQVAQAAPQPGQPVADVPASGAKEAQFVLPGTGEVIPQAISTDPAVRAAMGRYVTAPTERTRAVAKQALDLAVADAKQKQAASAPTDVQRNYEMARRQGYQGTFFDYQQELRKAGATNIDQRQEGEYGKTIGKALGERMDAISKEGDAARADSLMIGQLRELGGQIKNLGSGAALQGWLADRGIKVGPNVSEIEAYNALVDKMTPQQRVPGSGASSDLDVKMFKSALPSLIRTPGGNAIILDTLEAVAQDKAARAAIADRALTGELKPQDAIKELRALPDPMSAFKEARKSGFKNVPTPPSATSAVRPDGSAPPQPSAPPPVQGSRRAPDGNWYVPDPNRPGKYLQVQ